MRLENVVFGEQEAAQNAAQLGVGGARSHRGQIVDQARAGVELLVLVLREVVRLGVVPQGVFAGGHRFHSREYFDQRGFAGAVDAHQRHAVAALDDRNRRPQKTR